MDVPQKVLSDIELVLRVPEVVHRILGCPRLARLLLKPVSLLEMMNPCSREMGEHVHYEDEEWRVALGLEVPPPLLPRGTISFLYNGRHSGLAVRCSTSDL